MNQIRDIQTQHTGVLPYLMLYSVPGASAEERWRFRDCNHAFSNMAGMESGAVAADFWAALGAAGCQRLTARLCQPRQTPDTWEFSEEITLRGEVWRVSGEMPYPDTLVLSFHRSAGHEPAFTGMERNAQQEIEMILDSTQDALFLLRFSGTQFRYLRNNRVHHQMTGCPPEELAGKTPREFLGDLHGQVLEAYCHQCLSSGAVMSFEESLCLKNEIRTLMTKLTPVRRQDGASYIVGSRVDITHIREAEKHREQTLKRYQSMFDMHTAVMLILEPHSGQILDANHSACDFYGYSRHELRQLTIQDINVMQRKEVADLRQDALSQRQKYFLFRHRLRSGELRDVDVYSCPAVMGEDTVLFSIIFDVTQRELNKTELIHEKELLNTTLNSIADGVLTTDTAGRIIRANKKAEEILGQSVSALRGQLVSECLRPESEITGESRAENLMQTVCGREVRSMLHDYVFHVASGERVPVAGSVSPIIVRDDTHHGAVMLFRDVREERIKQKEILYLSYHDSLTGLHNRKYLDMILPGIDNPHNWPMTVVMGDINGLKMTNDIFGHGTGDELLRQITDTVKKRMTPVQSGIRWGGDEMVLILPSADVAEAEVFLAQLREDLAEICLRRVIVPNISFGYSVRRDNSASFDMNLKQAEEMMYRNKLLESRSQKNSVVQSILTTLHENSSETREHAERLRAYCNRMAGELQLPREEQNKLELLSLLHDIGKIGVDQRILKKPGSLDREEWYQMKKHPEIGYRIASEIPELKGISDYILHHHEKWDGTGYPKGLKQSEIPRICRILAVADAYDAMVSDRVYRPAMDREDAVRELVRHTGTQFDPQMVKVFVSKVLS